MGQSKAAPAAWQAGGVWSGDRAHTCAVGRFVVALILYFSIGIPRGWGMLITQLHGGIVCIVQLLPSCGL